ncbi:chymotrypsin B-like [Ptychodera flava]|uniref:chymotrypsin B-like n=1 Tax=Ptychodera flava TaxID=63121 RepID=UPI003969EC69
MKILNLLILYLVPLYLEVEGRLIKQFSEIADRSANVDRIRRITSGDEATPHSYPWMASLQLELYGTVSHFCGGTLIDKEWVLTAAHCMYGTPTDYMVIVLGDHDLSVDEGTEQRMKAAAIYVDNSFNEETCVSDVALIQLEPPGAEINEFVQPIKLATKRKKSGNCMVAGWGAEDINKDTSKILMEATVDIVENAECQRIWIEQLITGAMLCAGSSVEGICSGDSGGPLFCSEGGEWVSYGISSWGPPKCGINGVPDGYTRVSSYYDDITNVVSEDSVVSRASVDSSGKKEGAKKGNNGENLDDGDDIFQNIHD